MIMKSYTRLDCPHLRRQRWASSKITTCHLQDSATGDREPAAAARQLPLRILRPREGSDDQRHPHQHRRVLHHPQVTTYKCFLSLAIKLFESTI